MAKTVIASVGELPAWLGREVAASDWLAVDQARIDRFAEATGDRQWIHVDPERARAESPFGATVAHGFLTLSLVPQLLLECIELPPARMSLNYGLNRVRFAAPVRSGDRIRGRFSLAALEDVPGGVQLAWSAIVEIEGGDKPACVAELIMRLYS
ncbi:MAG TPA: MaoC family dehydratase [Candidatus Desulfobacillus sp.]|nr:MaoC family dehydratase [Candidatus Desulfobacillus sp.]